MKSLPVRKLWGVGEKTEQKLQPLGISTCEEMQRLSRIDLQEHFGKFGAELYDLCRGIDDRAVTPDRPRKSLSTEQTFQSDLTTLAECEEKLEELYQELMADLAQKEATRVIAGSFVKLKFNDFSRTTVDRARAEPTMETFRSLLAEGFGRANRNVRLIGIGVRFAEISAEPAQLALF